MDYNFKDIVNCYKNLGVKKGSTVIIKSNLFNLGFFSSNKKKEILNAHFNALSDLIDFSYGTLVVMTSTTYLCNTNDVYDHDNSPSERGVFSEYVRCQKNSIRSFHPFMSYCAIGKNAKLICENVSPFAWGENTPKERLIDLKAICLSVGIEPNLTCSTVHQVEYEKKVPYRYNKAFIHPILFEGSITNKIFYLFVILDKLKIERDRNKKIFKYFTDNGFILNSLKLGKGFAYSYNIHDFYKSTSMAFDEDLFIWTKNREYLQKVL
mgnify:CR=1 FL=1